MINQDPGNVLRNLLGGRWQGLGDQPGTRERLGGLLGSLGNALGDQLGAWERLGAPPGKPWDALADQPGAWERLGEPAGKPWGRLGGPSWKTWEKPWKNLLERPPRIHVRREDS